MKPNILVVVVDALRADKVGALGGRELTPTIDQLAETSAVFSNAHTTINTTDPAVTSLHTGRYPLSNGVIHHSARVTDREKASVEQVPRIPVLLSEHGYRTASFGRPLGRWHRHGFDIYPEINSSPPIKKEVSKILKKIHPTLYNLSRMLYNMGDSIVDFIYPHIAKITPTQSGVDHGRDRTNDVDMNSFETLVNSNKPFYAFVHLMDTHIPYECSAEDIQACLERFEYKVDKYYSLPDMEKDIIPNTFTRKVASGEYPNISEKYYFPKGEPSSAIVEAHYDASVMNADKKINHILKILKDCGAYENTLIILLADHGESLTEHGIYFDHHGLYDASIRIPIIIRSPNGKNRIVEELTQITDIAPTIASYAGIDGLQPDGLSLKPVVEKGKDLDREFVMAEEASSTRRRMIRTQNEKLIYLLKGSTVCRRCKVRHAPALELYDLQTDPDEQNNIAEEKPSHTADLRKMADSKAQVFASKCPNPSYDTHHKYEDEEEVLEQMEALGYK